MGLERIVDQMRPIHVAGRIETFHAGQSFRGPHPFIGEYHGVLFFLDFEVRVFRQLPSQFVGLAIFGDIVVRRTRNNERRAGFVDQNIVDLVDNGEIQRTLRLLRAFRVMVIVARGIPHVVAQVVETKLVVGAVGDIAGIGLLPLGGIHARLNGADGQAQIHVDGGHPLHIATSQIIVHRDDMHAAAAQGIQISRQRGDQRFAFAGNHFGDRARVQHHAADQLHVVMAHPQEPAAGFAANGEGFDQYVVQRIPLIEPLPEQGGLLLQIGIAHRLEFRLQGVDGVDLRLQLFDIPGVRRAEQRGNSTLHRPA